MANDKQAWEYFMETHTKWLLLSLALVAGCVSAPKSSSSPAQPLTGDESDQVWKQDLTAGGCANFIAVDPNDIPWIIACGDYQKDNVYYLGVSLNCGGGLGCNRWLPNRGFAATNLAVNLNGEVFASSYTGATAVNQWGNDSRGIGVPMGDWYAMTPYRYGPGSCISAVAVTKERYDDISFLDPQIELADRSLLGDTVEAFWGLGCGAGDNSVYVMNPPRDVITGQPWIQVDAGNGAAGVAIALFTSQIDGELHQTPWLMTGDGRLLSYDGNRFVSQPTPGSVPGEISIGAFSVTDHFAAIHGGTFGKFLVTGGVYRWDDAKLTWEYFITDIAPSGNRIAQIAHSEAFYSSTFARQIGPSRLWAIDTAGNIYYAAQRQGPH
jgi:hypothetical protein